MSYSSVLRQDFDDQHLSGPTTDGGGLNDRKVNCRLAVGSGPCFTDEMSSLLRTRLRLAILILLAGFAVHFLRNLFRLGPTYDYRPLYLWLCGGEIAVMVASLGLLFSRRPLSPRNLRALELAVFGLIAAFFAWLQIDAYYDQTLLSAIVPGHEGLVFRLVNLSGALRWFVMIVLYGTFIPNTGRRCAAIVGSLAMLPILLTIGTSLVDRAAAADILWGLPDTVKLMGIAVAIAVFGSYKLRQLHQTAHQFQQLGQYRLKEILGVGGMGTVYLAEHVLLRRPCAIKVIRPDQAGDPRTLVRFEREVRATATLTHWNTIEIFDYGHAEDGTFYYVMEYLPGMNLDDLVEQHGPLPPERAVHLLRQVCQALREAHGIGLIHRDIKPGNIFACERGKIYDVAKLLDFGLVKTSGLDGDSLKLTREGALTGSPAFMSPEQAAGREPLDARSDIYNVGAVGYFLMTGQLPFDRQSALQMLHAHAYEAFVPSQEFRQMAPADLQRVILRCLEKDPERRYPDAMTLEKALATCDCSGQWTPERAEDWWRCRTDSTAIPPALGPGKREEQTLVRHA
jgi:serine/threonine-protein kinase